MTRTSRRLAVTAGLSVLLLSACGEGQLRPGAAALVGDERITSSLLQEKVDAGLADPEAAQQLGGDRAEFQRVVLSRLVKRELLEAAAAQRGVEVSDGEVDAQLDVFVEGAGSRETLEMQASQSGVPPQELEPFVRDLVLEQALGDDLVADVDVPRPQLQELYQQNIGQYDQARSRHILVADEKIARTILGNVQRDPSRFPALAKQFSTDTSNKDTGGDLGLAPRGQFVPEFEKVLFSLPEGGFGLAKTEFGFHVINVVERQTTTLAEATPELRRAALEQEITAAKVELLVETAERVGVTVNPRFGTWNPETASVIADDDPSDVLVEPSPAAPADGGELLDPNAPQDPNAPADPSAPQDPNAPQEVPADPKAPAPAPSPAG